MKQDISSNEKKIRKLLNKASADFSLLEDGDRILVAVSGGKDSLVLTRLLGWRQTILKPRIEVEAVHVVMDNIPYETDTTYLEEFCKECGIKLNILHTSFDESTDYRKTRCFLCAWNRRKVMFRYANEHGFNKVALGHHQDDIFTTFLLNITFEGSLDTIKPKLKLDNYPLTLIRPLCLIRESMVKELAETLGVQKQKRNCPYEEVTNRNTMENLLHKLEDINPELSYSMWHAISQRFNQQ